MAGRRRRAASISTVASVDEPIIRHYQESTVLKPTSPNTHPDHWPCFELLDASVHRRDGSLVNQLNVEVEGPFVVRGRLEVEKDNEKYLIHRDAKRKSIWIQIEASYTSAFGTKDHSLSVPVIWASGSAGWFEISPADVYKPICDTMFQGVHLYWVLLDQLQEALEALVALQKSKKKKRTAVTFEDVKLSLDELLFQYALRVGDGLTLPEAYSRLHEQHIILLSRLPKDTSVYKYLAERFPDVVLKLGNKIDPDSALPNASQPCPLKAFPFSAREQSESLKPNGRGKRNENRPRSSAPGSSVTRTEQTSELSDMETGKSKQRYEAQSAIPARPKKKSSTPAINVMDEDVAMIDPPSIESIRPKEPRRSQPDPQAVEGTATTGNIIVDTLNELRQDLLQRIKEGSHKKQLHQITAKSWRTKVYMECTIRNYHSVEEIFLYHAPSLVKLLGPEWHNTLIYQWAKEKASMKPTFNTITEAEIQQIIRRAKKAARNGQTEKPSKKSPQEGVSQYAGKHTPKRGRPGGKAAGLRPSTGSKKRLRHEIGFQDDMDIDEDGSLKKRPKKSHFFTGEEDDDSNNEDSNSDDDMDEEEEASPSENKILGEAKHEPIALLGLRAENLPTAQPRGPNHTWICEEAGCGYIVRSADEDEGQKLISAHFEAHEREADNVAQEMALSRANLALQEATRGRMPVDHLLDKIRQISDKSKRRDNAMLNGQAVPEPIKKTLLI